MHLILPTFNRIQYLSRTLKSLARTDFPDNITINMTDDATKDKGALNLIQDFNLPNCPINKKYRTEGVGPEVNMSEALKESLDKSGDDFAILINDDIIFNPLWLKKMISAKNELIKMGESVGILTCFNTPTHKFTHMVNNDYGIKGVVGGCCTMYRREIVMGTTATEQGLDWTHTSTAGKLGFKTYCTVPSYVEHIGAYGHNSNGVVGDVATNFLGEEL